jgi:RNA polymerase sigma-70 factor (ECF subfamily)
MRVEQTLFVETEASLIEQARLGDSNAFGELVRNHYPSIITILYRLCGDEQLAEDAAQEAFIKAWVKLPSYHPQAPLRHWLYRIAVNTAHDLMRRRSDESMDDDEIVRTAELTDGTASSAQPGDPETALIEKEQSAMLQRALFDLPEASRAVLVLREYGDLSYQEIAHVLDIPIGTVMSRLNYARNRLQSILQEQTLKMENAYV